MSGAVKTAITEIDSVTMNECSSSVGSDEIKISKCALIKNGINDSNEAVAKTSLENGDLVKANEIESKVSNFCDPRESNVNLKDTAKNDSEVSDSNKLDDISKTVNNSCSAEMSEKDVSKVSNQDECSSSKNACDSVIETKMDETKSDVSNSGKPDSAHQMKNSEQPVEKETNIQISDSSKPDSASLVKENEVPVCNSNNSNSFGSTVKAKEDVKITSTDSDLLRTNEVNETKNARENESNILKFTKASSSESEVLNSAQTVSLAETKYGSTSENNINSSCNESENSSCTKPEVITDVSQKESEISNLNQENKVVSTGEESVESMPKADTESVTEMFTDDMISQLKKDLGKNSEDIECTNGIESDTEENSSPATKETDESEKNEAIQLFQQGKRNLLIKDFESAVEILSEACRKFTSIYGELAAECGEVFMTYGHALLELWRHEEENKKEDDAEDAKESSKIDITETTEEVEESIDDITATIDEPVQEDPTNDLEANDIKVTDEDKAITITSIDNGESMHVDEDEEKAADSNEQDEVADSNDQEEITDSNEQNETVDEENVDENNEDDADSEDVDNLQLAWEVFEIAKSIYRKHNDDLCLAKVYTKLGEISIAAGNHDLAIDDLKFGLDILNKLPSVDVRQLANIHFQLYIAYSSKFRFDDAEAELRAAKTMLEDEMNNLQGKLEDIDKEKNSSEYDKITSEIEDFKDLTRDMNLKIAEINSEKRNVMTTISKTLMDRLENPTSGSGDANAASSSSSTFSPVKSADVPVNNISHLVRKKPKILSDDEKTVNSEAGNAAKIVPETNEIDKSANNIDLVNVNNQESQTCKRKADDDEQIENDAKKVCVSQE